MMTAHTIIIPAYQPTEILIDLIRNLRQIEARQSILVVDDGSGPEYANIFTQLTSYNVTLLHHTKNMGKGAALKTAFSYWINSEVYQKSTGVITADADGQHSVEDILKLSSHLEHAPMQLHIGCRQFNHQDVPWRSRFGNELTRWICNKILNIPIEDTQSGLRAIPKQLVSLMLEAKTQRYEFELEMLLIAKKNQIMISNVPIQTIYIDQNRASHFNPVVDSLKIYFVFVRFAFISMMSGLLDMLIFFLMFYLCEKIYISSIAGRIISGAFNFGMNKHFAFKNVGRIAPILFKYVTLSGLLLLSSYSIITLLYTLGFSIYFSKIFADSLLYIISFLVQRSFVFKKSNSEHMSLES